MHPDLAPLRFLLGRWEGAGIGGYPTIESFRFGQEITFSHNGKPFLSYTSRTWALDDDGQIGRPLGTEAGYWRPQPDNQIEVMLAHPTGIVEIYLGEITGTRIEMATDVVARTATAKEVTAGHRLYGLAGSDLAYAYDLAAMGQRPATPPIRPTKTRNPTRITSSQTAARRLYASGASDHCGVGNEGQVRRLARVAGTARSARGRYRE